MAEGDNFKIGDPVTIGPLGDLRGRIRHLPGASKLYMNCYGVRVEDRLRPRIEWWTEHELEYGDPVTRLGDLAR